MLLVNTVYRPPKYLIQMSMTTRQTG